MKKTLLWFAVALFLTAVTVPTTLMADGNPGFPPRKGLAVQVGN